jgi:aryl-alcohol dehydrogenase-like predicted oxidoreductase
MGMELRSFGRTGLMMSPLTLGTMEFGSKVDETETARLLESAVDIGVNSVDTANVYASGRSEEILGRLIGAKRNRLILATKFSVPTGSGGPQLGWHVAPNRDLGVRSELAPAPH